MNEKQTLTGIVIAKNEEKRIGACLQSLTFCDELVVIDNDSTDDTARIAKKHGATLIQQSSSDFSTLRNCGKDRAKGTWILYVDADETVTEELKKEIVERLRIANSELKKKNNAQSDMGNQQINQSIVGYYIPRTNYYLGHKWPVRDKMQRLFLKKALIRWEGALHETARIEGKMGDLKEPLIHDTHRNLEEMVAKTNEWSAVEAKLRFDAHHPNIVWWRLLRVMWTGFSRSFFHEGGWRMGTVGWIESIYQGFSMFLTYAKLWEMQEKKKSI